MCTADFTFHIGSSSQEFTWSFLGDRLLLFKKRVPLCFSPFAMLDYEDFASSGNNCIVIWRESEEKDIAFIYLTSFWFCPRYITCICMYICISDCWFCIFVSGICVFIVRSWSFWLFFWTDFGLAKFVEICIYIIEYKEPLSFFTFNSFFLYIFHFDIS